MRAITTATLTREPAGESTASGTYAATTDAVPQARALTRTLAAGQRDTAALVVTELVTNAVLHADTATVTVEVTDTRDGLRIAVTDDDPGHLPTWTGDPRPMDQHGRGLRIVARLCDRLCCTTGPQSKTVRATLGQPC